MRLVSSREEGEPRGDAPGAALRAIAGRLVALADQLDGSGCFDQEVLSLALTERNELLLLVWAEAEYGGRRKRTAYLPDDLLGEPAWDLLLDLYIQRAKRKRVSVTSACTASGAPQSTALRWLSLLDEQGLTQRVFSEQDRRVQYVELTDKGILAIARWLRYRAALPVY